MHHGRLWWPTAANSIFASCGLSCSISASCAGCNVNSGLTVTDSPCNCGDLLESTNMAFFASAIATSTDDSSLATFCTCWLAWNVNLRLIISSQHDSLTWAGVMSSGDCTDGTPWPAGSETATVCLHWFVSEGAWIEFCALSAVVEQGCCHSICPLPSWDWAQVCRYESWPYDWNCCKPIIEAP